jgi:hypothetical protein
MHVRTLGKKAEALDTLKKAFAAGFGNRNWAAKDSDFNCLHDDPGFQKLVGLDKNPAWQELLLLLGSNPFVCYVLLVGIAAAARCVR